MKNILRPFFLLLLLANLMGKNFDEKELIFVYNVKSGLFNELLDFAHKIISPETYECNLYAITYGTFKMEKRWSRYIQSLPLKSIFTYKDEISKNNLPNVNLPSILLREHNDLIELLTSREINDLNNFDQLIRVLDKRLEEYGMKTEKSKRVNLSDEEWQKKLTPEEYHILREKGTERPFTGEYDKFYEEGIYKCAGCDTELFTSDTKYDSGCGWPAFYETMPGKIEETEDNSFGMTRIEITCENCGGHLGHVFNDGPKPTGIRYCVNSASLDFKPENKK
tara:strand:- start:28246 stop:29085 length:840 start_codon:yes stop_codon:yes gene_type:complete